MRTFFLLALFLLPISLHAEIQEKDDPYATEQQEVMPSATPKPESHVGRSILRGVGLFLSGFGKSMAEAQKNQNRWADCQGEQNGDGTIVMNCSSY